MAKIELRTSGDLLPNPMVSGMGVLEPLCHRSLGMIRFSKNGPEGVSGGAPRGAEGPRSPSGSTGSRGGPEGSTEAPMMSTWCGGDWGRAPLGVVGGGGVPHEWGAGDARAGGEPPQGVGVSAVPHPGRGSNPPHPPPPHSPPNACANRPPRGEGRAGEPPPRGAPWGAFATSRAASPLSRSRVARKELPARGLAATQSLRALCAGQAAWHPATATQRWLARKRSEKSPLKVSRPHDTQPLPIASALA